MPFTGQYTYTPLAEYKRRNAEADLSAKYGTVQGTGINTTDPWITGMQGDQAVQYANPFLGKDPSAGADEAWFNDYVNKTYGGAPEGRPTLVNGQVRENTYKDPGDAEGLGVMAALGGGLFGMAGAAGALGSGGAASGFGNPEMFNLVPQTGANLTGGAAAGGAMDLGDWWDWGTGGTGTNNPVGNWIGDGPGEVGGPQMPAATPETTQQLKDWGMTETSPGNWSQPTVGSAGDSIWRQIQQATGLAPKDALNLLGKLGAAGVQAFSSNRQAGQLQSLAQKYMDFGAPSRARYEASMTPGFDPTTIPGYSGALDTASKGILARLSATSGNPFGNPGGLIDANKQIVAGTALPAISEYQRLNLAGGGLANLNAAVPSLATGSIQAASGVPAAIGSAIGSATAPDTSLAGYLAQLKAAGIDLGTGLKLSGGTILP